MSLIGPGGLLTQLTKNVVETARNADLTVHLGHEHGGTSRTANMRNGTGTTTVLTEIGLVAIEVPCDRDGVVGGRYSAQVQAPHGRDRWRSCCY